MGRLTFALNVTLDGCCDHREMIADDELHDHFTRLIGAARAMLYGRKTYELMEEYWPAVARAEKASRAGAYLGQVLVSGLGGRWVPRRNLEEAQVVIGDRAWLPFVRARRWSQSRQSVLDYSLTKLYREAERHHGVARGSR